MKKLLASAIGAACVLVLVTTEASAWYCRATSPSAYGWGHNYYRSRAAARALAECAVRTPRWQTCYIRYCRPG